MRYDLIAGSVTECAKNSIVHCLSYVARLSNHVLTTSIAFSIHAIQFPSPLKWWDTSEKKLSKLFIYIVPAK